MGESNRRRLERLEQMAHVSVGDVRMDAMAAIELDALILEAEIEAHRMMCKAFDSPKAFYEMSPDSSLQKMKTDLKRERLAGPLRIKELCKALEQRVPEHGATPAVKTVLAGARRFLAATA
jgi:hypothetical protein